ncbi:MAG: hypothetical protein DKT66_27010 [Candidatus Melainabacteria bacterium]|nr:MAG: hypothetical protein DKT66_27010 [Candidatus Melainabacteria bacterium]
MKAQKFYALVFMALATQFLLVGAGEKKMSTYQRQTYLMKRINDAQKSKELTVSQAKGLRKDLSRVAVRKQKVRDARPGKDQSENLADIEEKLTETSEKLERLKLENRKNSD